MPHRDDVQSLRSWIHAVPFVPRPGHANPSRRAAALDAILTPRRRSGSYDAMAERPRRAASSSAIVLPCVTRTTSGGRGSANHAIRSSSRTCNTREGRRRTHPRAVIVEHRADSRALLSATRGKRRAPGFMKREYRRGASSEFAFPASGSVRKLASRCMSAFIVAFSHRTRA